MKLYAKIVRHPGLSTKEYEYRYRCCNSEFHVKFDKRGAGRLAGTYKERACLMIDLRSKDGEPVPCSHCPMCNTLAPQPWLEDYKDSFLQEYYPSHMWSADRALP